MSNADLWVVIGLGGLFLLLGIGALLWGRGEERDYYKGIAGRRDVREYMEHTPERPEPGGLKIGGVIAVLLGVILVIVGGALMLGS